MFRTDNKRRRDLKYKKKFLETGAHILQFECCLSASKSAILACNKYSIDKIQTCLLEFLEVVPYITIPSYLVKQSFALVFRVCAAYYLHLKDFRDKTLIYAKRLHLDNLDPTNGHTPVQCLYTFKSS